MGSSWELLDRGDVLYIPTPHGTEVELGLKLGFLGWRWPEPLDTVFMHNFTISNKNYY